MGASAGGHLALLAAYTPQLVEALPPKNPQADTSVCGVVSLYGITDLESAHRYFQRIPTAGERAQSLLRFLGVAPRTGRVVGPPDFIPSVLGGLPNEPALRHHPGSPLNHVGPESPPTLLIHGSHDFGVEVAQSRVMYRALRAAGVPAVFVELAEADHAFDLFFMEYAPAFQAAVYDVERFLAWLG
jgi:acetyl esterase/lipase